MAEARRDQNRVTTLIGASSVDDSTPIRAWINPADHRLLVDAEIQSLIEVAFPSVDTGVYGQITVGTSATLIRPANTDRISLQITNLVSEEVYVGFDASVLTTTGFQLSQQDVISFTGSDLYKGAVYGIVTTGSADVRFFEL
jgi:hypothetical protein